MAEVWEELQATLLFFAGWACPTRCQIKSWSRSVLSLIDLFLSSLSTFCSDHICLHAKGWNIIMSEPNDLIKLALINLAQAPRMGRCRLHCRLCSPTRTPRQAATPAALCAPTTPLRVVPSQMPRPRTAVITPPNSRVCTCTGGENS